MNIYQSMGQPVSEKMQLAHTDIKMSEDGVYYIAAYLSQISTGQLAEHKIFPVKLILFLAFEFLMTLAIIDLLFLHKIKYKIIHIAVLLTGIAVHTGLAVVEAQNLSRTKNYAPD